MNLSDTQRHTALRVAARLHPHYDAMTLDDAVRELVMLASELAVVMHGAGILRACGDKRLMAAVDAVLEDECTDR